MRNVTVFRSLAALGALAAAAWGSAAYAIEPGSAVPHQPGITSGLPIGALPPAGYYVTNDFYYLSGSLNDGNGNTVKAPAAATNVIAYVDVPVLLWASPFHILGAQYAAALSQPLDTVSITTAGATTTKTGIYNTVLTPALLSWQLPLGFFVSGSFSVYLQDGDTGDRGNGTQLQHHIANNTYTFEPGAAVSWFNGKGFEASINGVYDVQTQNDHFNTAPVQVAPGVFLPQRTKYQSGDVLDLDFSAQQAFGKWSGGVVGYYTVQTTDDTTNTTVAGINLGNVVVPATAGVNGTGNRFEKFALGPSVSYNFGSISLNFRYTHDLFANNSLQTDVWWFRLSIPL